MRAETLTLCTMHTARNPANPGLSTSTFMWDAAWISLFFLLVFPSTQEKINMVSPLKVFVLDIASIPLSLSLFESVWLCLCLCVLTLLQSVSLPLCLCLCSPFSPPPTHTHTHLVHMVFEVGQDELQCYFTGVLVFLRGRFFPPNTNLYLKK